VEDYVSLVLGIFTAVASGAGFPFMSVFIGKVFDNLIAGDSLAMQTNSLLMCYIGIGMFAACTVYDILLTTLKKRMLVTVRTRV